jgi:hypothetical protein
VVKLFNPQRNVDSARLQGLETAIRAIAEAVYPGADAISDFGIADGRAFVALTPQYADDLLGHIQDLEDKICGSARSSTTGSDGPDWSTTRDEGMATALF